MPDLASRAFLLRAVLWLVIVFVAWAWLAPVLLLPVAWLTEPVLTALQPQAVAGVEASGKAAVDIVTRFDASMLPARNQTPERAHEIAFSVNALKYGYGLPLIVALTLAAEGVSTRRRVLCVLGGSVLVLAVQVWGVSFEALLVLGRQLGPRVAEVLDFSPFAHEAVALGYQLGSLIFPPVLPVVWWGGCHLRLLVPAFRAPVPGGGD
ncbi:exosortase H-associated membrane protein [Arhodomonas sp. AD133]|uniref:exosortase H-associated membrane protein n=1 Tax=Arhodomonas sp. AD133 TaxID=3415009 RepID=UPI003EBF8560